MAPDGGSSNGMVYRYVLSTSVCFPWKGMFFFSRKVFYSRVENDYIRHMTHTDFLNNDKAPELECFFGGGGVFVV